MYDKIFLINPIRIYIHCFLVSIFSTLKPISNTSSISDSVIPYSNIKVYLPAFGIFLLLNRRECSTIVPVLVPTHDPSG